MKLRTAVYEIEIPELFEKVLQYGQLLRCERMDRAEGEQSFAELNFFVGRLDEEEFSGDRSASRDFLRGMWGTLVEKEGLAVDLPPDHQQHLKIDEETLSGLLKLEKASWRPASGQFVFQRLFPESPEHFAQFVLEFDWDFLELYRGVALAMWSSLEWQSGALNLEAMAEEKYSIFDDMVPDKHKAILGRYRQILGPPDPVQPDQAEITTWDLRETEPSTLSLQDLEEGLIQVSPHDVQAELLCGFQEEAVELTFVLEGGAKLGPPQLEVLQQLVGLGPEQVSQAKKLLWEHCQMCFEATDYGADEGQSNQDYFGIHNAEEAWQQKGSASIFLCVEEDSSEEEFVLHYYPPWEDEHGCGLRISNGQFVGFGD